MYDTISEKEIAAGRKALMGGWESKARPNIIFIKAKGAKIWDKDGKEYIDCTSQAFALGVGACHPKVIKAAEEQLRSITHTTYGFDNIPLLLLSGKIASLAPGNLNRVNFCLSGGMAAEGAMKIALENRAPARYFITFEHGYHGRSFATIPASFTDPEESYPSYMENIIKLPEAYCYRCAYGLSYPSCKLRCATFIEDTIKRRVSGGVAGLIMEPVQGNGGQICFPQEFYQRVREICTRNNVLLIWDEVQTAFGRVGRMFASELYNVVPDIITFGKGVSGGFPLSGFIAREDLKGFETARHAFTFAHSPVSLAAALATIEVLQEEKLPERAERLGRYITGRLEKMKEKYPIIGDIRGPALAIGIELVKNRETKEPAIEEAHRVVNLGMERGVMFGITKYARMGNTLKIKPPLVITDDEVEKALSVFEECISQVS